MSPNRVTYTLESTLQSVNAVEGKTREFAAAAGLGKTDIYAVVAAVHEAAVNAVLHGNAFDPAKKIHVTLERRDGILQITVRDEGQGFNPAAVADPLASENLLKQSGRGIFLMRSYMDEVQFQSTHPGTAVILMKYLRSASADTKEKAKP